MINNNNIRCFDTGTPMEYTEHIQISQKDIIQEDGTMVTHVPVESRFKDMKASDFSIKSIVASGSSLKSASPISLGVFNKTDILNSTLKEQVNG